MAVKSVLDCESRNSVDVLYAATRDWEKKPALCFQHDLSTTV